MPDDGWIHPREIVRGNGNTARDRAGGRLVFVSLAKGMKNREVPRFELTRTARAAPICPPSFRSPVSINRLRGPEGRWREGTREGEEQDGGGGSGEPEKSRPLFQ